MESEGKILVLSTKYKCRCCLSVNSRVQYSMTEIYDSEIISKMFEDCFDIKVTDSDPLKKICQRCVVQLNQFYKFKNLVKQNNQRIIQETFEVEVLQVENQTIKTEDSDSQESATISENFEIKEEDVLDSYEIKVEEDKTQNFSSLTSVRPNNSAKRKIVEIAMEQLSKLTKKLPHSNQELGNYTVSLTTEPPTFTCNACNLDIRDIEIFKNHLREYHVLSIADRKYFDKLSKNLPSKHTRPGEAETQKIVPIQCKICGSIFMTQSLLRNHEVVHDELR